MSLQRTPRLSTNRSTIRNSPHETRHDDFVSRRVKRKFSNENSPDNSALVTQMREMFAAFETQQNLRFEKLLESVNIIKDQNSEFQKCVDFLSSKYDEALDKIASFEQQQKSYEHKIISLESKIEQFERNSHASTIEIRNIPKQPSEDNCILRSIVQKTGEIIQHPVSDSDIRDIYRTKTNSDANGRIVVSFTTTTCKENFIKQCRVYNKTRRDNKLNSSTLQLPGPPKMVFVSECLTKLGRRLAYLARQAVKEHNFHTTWTSFGKVFIKKTPDSMALRIDSEQDIHKLNTK